MKTVIVKEQYGFQSGLSCEIQLINAVHDWSTSFDYRTQIDAILLDFSKAFDKAPNHCLVTKLSHNGITSPTLNG